MTLINPSATFQYSHQSKDGSHKETWFVGHGPYGPGRDCTFVQITVDEAWFRKAGSINALKSMAIAEAEKTHAQA